MTIEEAGEIIGELIGEDYTIYRRYTGKPYRKIDEFEVFWGYDRDQNAPMSYITADSWEELIEAVKNGEKK